MDRAVPGAHRLRARRRVAAAAMWAVLAATACGTAPQAAPTKVLHVVMTDDWVTTPFLDAVREFERTHPGVQVSVEKGPIGRMSDLVRAGQSSGAPPDVVQGHATTGAGHGLAQPVDDLWARHGLRPEEFLPGAVEDVTWGGRRYGVPLDSNAMALLVNLDRFDEAGLAPPGPGTTFGDLEDLARRLTSPDGARRALAVAVDSWVTYGWVRANGGELVSIDDRGTPRFSLDAPAVVETLAFLDRLVDQRLAFGPGGPDARSLDAYALFKAGATAMYASGSWDLVRALKDVPGGRFGVALMPRGTTGRTQGTVMGGSSLWIPAGARHRDLAFEFMTLVSSDPYALRFAKTEGRLPVRPRLFSDPHFGQPQLRVFVEQLGSAHPSVLGALAEGSRAFNEALTGVLLHGDDPRPALERAQRRAQGSAGPP